MVTMQVWGNSDIDDDFWMPGELQNNYSIVLCQGSKLLLLQSLKTK